MGLKTSLEERLNEVSYWLYLDGVPPETWAHQILPHPQTIGRDETNEIVLLNTRVSRQHAKISIDETGIFLRDLGSRNGTLVDGTRISSRTISFESSFQIGKLTLQIASLDQIRSGIMPNTYDSTQAGSISDDAEQTISFFLRQKNAHMDQLSKAQIRVLRLLLVGASEAEAAAQLHLSPNTIHSHVKAIYKTLEVKSRASLMAKFIAPQFKTRET